MQGFNMGRYRPPESLDATLSAETPSQSQKSRRLNSAGSSASPPTVRFEMPFAIWCATCPDRSTSQLIGQGVRFNAQKKKVGNYYSTPVWSFRMKHAACGGWIEIRTDPRSSEYVVSEGARRRDTGDDLAVAGRVGGVVIGGSAGPGEDADRQRKRQDAFAALEGKKEETARAKGEAARIEELRSLRERDWRDSDAASRKLRDGFRVGRRKRDRDAATGEALQERMGLGFELLEETDEDGRRAAFVEFGGVDEEATLEGGAELKASSKPLFEPAAATSVKSRAKPKSKSDALQRELSSNTRAVADPFSSRPIFSGISTTSQLLSSIKRRRNLADTDRQGTDLSAEGPEAAKEDPSSERVDRQTGHVKPATQLVTYGELEAPLVNYDSE